MMWPEWGGSSWKWNKVDGPFITFTVVIQHKALAKWGPPHESQPWQKNKTINIQFGKKIISLVHQFMPATYIDRKNNQVLFGRYDLTVHPFWGRFFGVVCHEIVWGKCTLNIFCSPPTPPQPINKQLKCSSSYKRESTFINRQKYPSHKQRQNYWAASFNDGKPHSGHRNNFNPTKLINKNVIKWSNEIRIAFEVWLNWIIYF